MRLSALLSSVVIAGVAQPSSSTQFANPPGYKTIPNTPALEKTMYEALRNDANYRPGEERICMNNVTEVGTANGGKDYYFHGNGCAVSSATPDGHCPKDCDEGILVVNVRKNHSKTEIYTIHSHLREVYPMPPRAGNAGTTGSGSKSSGKSSTRGSGSQAPVPPTVGSSSKAAPPTAGSSSKAAPPTAGSSSKAAPPTAGSSSKAAPPTAGSSSKAAPPTAGSSSKAAPAPAPAAPAPGPAAPAPGPAAPRPSDNTGNAVVNLPDFHSAHKDLMDIWKTIDMPNGLQRTIGDVFQFHGKTFCVDSISNVQYQTFSDPQQYLRAIREGLYRVNVNGCFSSSVSHCGCTPMAYTGVFSHVRGSHSYVISNIVKTGDKPAYCP